MSLLESEKGQYVSLLEREHFQVFVDKWSQGSGTHVSGLRWQTYGSCWVSLYLLSDAFNHLDRWERGLPHLGQLDKLPLSLKRFNVFQTVDLAIESVFAIAESDFAARCNVSIAFLLPDICKLAKVSHKNKW